jgi:uncharacterized OB-fold protein
MSKTPEYPTMKSRTLTLTHEIPISRIKIYWEGLKEGNVYATKCKKCNQIYYPPQVDCPNCLISNMDWIQLSDGKLETFTQVYLKPQGFSQHENDYIIAIAKTVEGAKIMGWLEEKDIRIAKVGMPVKVLAKIMPDGFPAIIFKPAVKNYMK